MIFADKLILLRKKAGWSQEELAEQMNVTRQSVSKWEGAQSVPDLDKMIRLSELFLSLIHIFGGTALRRSCESDRISRKQRKADCTGRKSSERGPFGKTDRKAG